MRAVIFLSAAMAVGSLDAQTSKPAAAQAKPSAPLEVSADMQGFLAPFDGTDKAVQAALKKYGAAKLDDKDMHIYNLKTPKVTESAAKGDQQCYTFTAGSGMTTRAYVTCWRGGKIVAVEDKGMQ